MLLQVNSLSAADVMQTNLATVSPDTHFSHAVELMIRRGVSGLPIVDAAQNYIGMFSEKCCMRIIDESPDLIATHGQPQPTARDVMTANVITLYESDEVMQSIHRLLNHRVSGAPVLDAEDCYVGVFSEKTSISALLQIIFDGMHTAEIRNFVNRDAGRSVVMETPLPEIVQTFVGTEYRRIPVIRNRRVVGQISRRDVANHPNVYRRIMQLAHGNFGNGRKEVEYCVTSFSDTTAKTIDANLDVLSIMNMFLNTPYRRMPVLDNGKLIGQVSRRDVLDVVLKHTQSKNEQPTAGSLYLSALQGTAPRFE